PDPVVPAVSGRGSARSALGARRGDCPRPCRLPRRCGAALRRGRSCPQRHGHRAPQRRLQARRTRPPSGGRRRHSRRRSPSLLRRAERRRMSRLKTLVRNEHGVAPLRGGHALCQGCGIPMVVRTIVDTIDTPVVVVNATGCLEVATTRFPTTSWNVPWLHVAFENAAAVVSGVESAYRALARRNGLPQEGPVTFLALAGDGGTYDIGLQALSGALERGHRFIFVCYDNEAYMNTGVQRSGATPFGASTTTSPA